MTGQAISTLAQVESTMQRTRAAREEAERKYLLAIRSSRPDSERIEAYSELQQSRTEEAWANQQFTELQTQPGAFSVSEYDIFEAAAKAVKNEGGKGMALTVVENAKRSLVLAEFVGAAERCQAYVYLHEQILKDDRGFFLFADAAEKFARLYYDKQIAKSTKGNRIRIVDGFKKNDPPELVELIELEIAEYYFGYDSRLESATEQVLEAENPEVAKLFRENRSEYERKKTVGRKALLGSDMSKESWPPTTGKNGRGKH